jgi:hypothetical protein
MLFLTLLRLGFPILLPQISEHRKVKFFKDGNPEKQEVNMSHRWAKTHAIAHSPQSRTQYNT